jgi:hypothetical protein
VFYYFQDFVIFADGTREIGQYFLPPRAVCSAKQILRG